MRKKVNKYYLVVDKRGRKYGAFHLGEEGKKQADAYAAKLKKKFKEEFKVTLN